MANELKRRSWAKQKQQASLARLLPGVSLSASLGHFLSPSACHVGAAVFLNLALFCCCVCLRRAAAARFRTGLLPVLLQFQLSWPLSEGVIKQVCRSVHVVGWNASIYTGQHSLSARLFPLFYSSLKALQRNVVSEVSTSWLFRSDENKVYSEPR